MKLINRNNQKYPTYQVVQNLLNAKMNQKNISKVASQLRYSVPNSSLNPALDQIFKTIPACKQLLWGNMFPDTIEKLGECNGYFYASENIFADVDWIYKQVADNCVRLKEFIILRDKIEKDILIGNYDTALNELELVRTTCGLSIWYYEQKMLIYNYSGNERKVLEMLSDVNMKKKDAKYGFVPFLLSLLAKRCSVSYSAYAYDSEIDQRFLYHRTDFQKDKNAYFLFRLNMYHSLHKENSCDLSPVLVMESTNSLIDRLVSVERLLLALFVKSKDEPYRRRLSGYASKFYKKVNDSHLAPIVVYSHKESMSDEYYCQSFIDLLDLYYSGKYAQCINAAKSYLDEELPLFDVIKIYCRSLIYLNKPFSSITINSECIINQIAHITYELMTTVENREHLDKLYQICKNIDNLSLSICLQDFINGETKIHDMPSLGRLGVFVCDPAYTNIYEYKELKNDYLDFASRSLSSYAILPYQYSRVEQNITNNIYIAKYIKDSDTAKMAFVKNKYEDSLHLWLSLLNANKNIIPIVQTAVDYIYRCYEMLDKKQEAIKAFVDYYINGSSYVSRINAKPLEEKLYLEKYKKGVRNGIELQLFIFINSSEDERKSRVLEMYCAYMDVEKVSDLLPMLKSKMPNDMIEIYLLKLITDDILRHMLYVHDTRVMLDEQQKISQFLTTLTNSPYHEIYKELNKEIIDTMIAYNTTKKIDESKIFVNIPALIQYELKDCEGLYNQFKNQIGLSATSNAFFLVNTTDSIGIDYEKDEIITAPVRFTSKPFIDASCQVFNTIRDKFLFSKFGLKTYLSTRIRHGVFEGVLRAGLQELHLLLQTSGNNYMPNNYWRAKYSLTAQEDKDLMCLLGKFTSGVNLAIDGFKQCVLQIKVHDDDNGLFDYRLTPDQTCFVTVAAQCNTKSFDEFCSFICEYLLKLTDKSLGTIRHELKTQLKSLFDSLLDNLNRDVVKFENNDSMYKEISAAINSARADTNLKIGQIEKWFYLQDKKFDDFSLSHHMGIVWDVTLKMYPNIQCNVDYFGREYDMNVKATYFIHISDILTIFYNNMLSYSKREILRQFRIGLKRQDDVIILYFENSIDKDETELNKTFDEMLKADDRLSIEGKSGLVKVKKIIKYDLKCEDNSLFIRAENGKCITEVAICANIIKA